MIQRKRNPQPAPPFIYRFIPQTLLFNRKSILVTTAFSIVFGIFAYYYKNSNTFRVDAVR
jgi:ABC-type dipeptide/oligopeptide/nickel transport system permease component